MGETHLKLCFLKDEGLSFIFPVFRTEFTCPRQALRLSPVSSVVLGNSLAFSIIFGCFILWASCSTDDITMVENDLSGVTFSCGLIKYSLNFLVHSHNVIEYLIIFVSGFFFFF